MRPEDETPGSSTRNVDGAGPRSGWRSGLVVAVKVVLFLGLIAGLASAVLLGAGYWIARRDAPRPPLVTDDLETLRARNAALRKKLDKLLPRGLHMLVDTARNRLYLKDGDTTVREVVVSCGSGGVLQDPSGKKTWVFDTPRGERVVKSKVKNPTWIKPDWAFIEEGEAIPKKYDDRAEEGVLGDYAFGIGDGYFIHGTLYTRLLGRNVTHGCIRVGDADLEYLFQVVPLGTKVYIF